VSLFGKSEEKAAQDEAAKAEADRLQSLSVPELAEALMPAFGPDGPTPGGNINQLQVGMWLMSSYPRGNKYMKDLRQPISEGVQALENGGLVVGSSQSAVSWFKATRLGETALAEGSVGRYVKDPTAP
jgi:hypothetical protein